MLLNLSRRDLLKLLATAPFAEDLFSICFPMFTSERFSLSAIGWVAEDAVAGLGNRLRWIYPSSANRPDAPTEVWGAPDNLVVERADLSDFQGESIFSPHPNVGSIPTMYAPTRAWKILNVNPGGAENVVDLPVSAQGVYFEYTGPETLVTVEDQDGTTVVELKLEQTSRFYFEAGEIRRIRIGANSSVRTLKQFKYLDLYDDAWLEGLWKPITRIDVSGTLTEATKNLPSNGDAQATTNLLGDIVRRLSPAVPIPQEILEVWKSILQSFRTAQSGGTGVPKGISPWDVFAIAVHATWRSSVLAGFGYIDGPSANSPFHRDKVYTDNPPLSEAASKPVAYRIRAERENLKSNYVVVNPMVAAALNPPQPFSPSGDFIVAPVVVNSLKEGSTTDDPISAHAPSLTFMSTGTIDWHQRNFWERGIEIAEKSDAGAQSSPWSNVRHIPDTFEALERVGKIEKNVEVKAIDVTLRFKGRSFDGWDRTSAYCPEIQTVPVLKYSPVPPALEQGSYDSITERMVISRNVKSPWSEDEIVKNGNPVIAVYRRLPEPTVQAVIVEAVTPRERGEYLLQLDTALDPVLFTGGQITNDPTAAPILQINGKLLVTRLEHFTKSCENRTDVAGPQIISVGPAKVIRSRDHPSMWDLKKPLYWGNLDPLDEKIDVHRDPPEGKVEYETYAARVELNRYGIKGPFSNTVTVIKLPKPPLPPPKFSVATLGLDYYNRTLIEIAMDLNVSGVCDLAWCLSNSTWNAPGENGRLVADVNPEKEPERQTRFRSRMMEGVIGRQSCFQERKILDLIALPLTGPDQYVTIGIRKIDQAGQSSDYRLVEFLAEVP